MVVLRRLMIAWIWASMLSIVPEAAMVVPLSDASTVPRAA